MAQQVTSEKVKMVCIACKERITVREALQATFREGLWWHVLCYLSR